MSNFAIIENGVVVNTVVADEEYAVQQGWVYCPIGGIGWSYNEGVFSAPESTIESTEQIQRPTPTKEDLLAQLEALQQQIQALV
jgi:hypothetical protein